MKYKTEFIYFTFPVILKSSRLYEERGVGVSYETHSQTIIGRDICFDLGIKESEICTINSSSFLLLKERILESKLIKQLLTKITILGLPLLYTSLIEVQRVSMINEGKRWDYFSLNLIKDYNVILNHMKNKDEFTNNIIFKIINPIDIIPTELFNYSIKLLEIEEEILSKDLYIIQLCKSNTEYNLVLDENITFYLGSSIREGLDLFISGESDEDMNIDYSLIYIFSCKFNSDLLSIFRLKLIFTFIENKTLQVYSNIKNKYLEVENNISLQGVFEIISEGLHDINEVPHFFYVFDDQLSKDNLKIGEEDSVWNEPTLDSLEDWEGTSEYYIEEN
ncbi:hypothetical protein (mitochondrion) [Myxobolus squamalis]|uniref:Uncharacterized protein n=1 Tax=Myxobolus squamalis TaxID=59785 RepID=A0A678XD83_MYXSQ|nr:hypothetical protein [Myxobolus squamalis]